MHPISRKIILLFLVNILSSLYLNITFAADSPTGVKRDPFYAEGAKYEQNLLSDTPNENINLYTGDLNISQTDIYLPGNNGLDLIIQRTYNSRLWQVGGGKKIPYGIAEMSCLGFGWSMHMGRVEDAEGDGTGNRLPIVVMPDGSRHPFYKDKNDPTRLISKEFWIYKNTGPNKWELTLTNGTKYTFEFYEGGSDYPGYYMIISEGAGWITEPFPTHKIAQATEIKDIHNNTIKIKYHRINPSNLFLNIPKISQIIDSCKRQIDFTYYDNTFSPNMGLLKNITCNGRSYIYSYSNRYSELYKNLLTEVHPPEGNSWFYNYYDTYDNASLGLTGHDLLLHSMTYPTGAIINYTYDQVELSAGKTRTGDNSLVPYDYYTDLFKVLVKKTISGRNLPPAEYNYGYWSSRSRDRYPTNYDLLYDSTTVYYPGGKKEIYYFYGWGATQPIKVIDNYLEHQYCDTLWELGQIVKKEIYQGNAIMYKEEYSYDKSEEPIANAAPEYFLGGAIMQREGTFISLRTNRNIDTNGHGSKIYYTVYSNFDAYGNPQLITETGQKSRKTEYSYLNSTIINKYFLGKLLQQKEIYSDNEVYISSYTYSTNGDLLSATELGIKKRYAYDPTTGNLISETNDLDISTVFDIYQYGKPTVIYYGVTQLNPLIYVYKVTQSINPTGTVASVINGLGFVENYKYDKMNRSTKIIPSKDGPNDTGSVIESPTTIDYTADASTITVTKGANVTEYYYDGLGRYSGQKNAVGDQTKVYYDAIGNKDFMSYPFAGTSEVGEKYEYDVIGRMLEVKKPVTKDGLIVGPQLSIISYNYKDAINSIDITDENNNTTSYFYESYGNPDKKQIASVKDPQSQTTTYEYNGIGSLLRIEQPNPSSDDPDGKVIISTFTYNSHNQLVTEYKPEKGLVAYEYDAIGNLLTKTDARQIIKYNYDALNRLTAIHYPTPTYDAFFTYDKADNIINEANSFSVIISSYNAINKVIERNTKFGTLDNKISYTYDKNGFPSSMTYPKGDSIQYTYDKADRVKKLDPYIDKVIYHPSGKMAEVDYHNNTKTIFNFDEHYRISNLTTQNPAGPFVNYHYEYDKKSNISYIKDTNDFLSLSYDSLDRLSGGNGSWDIGGKKVFYLNYEYDNIGNRKKKTINEDPKTLYSYSQNRLVKTSEDTFKYDNTGNLIYKNGRDYNLGPNDKIISAGSLTLTYDAENKLIQESNDSGSKMSIYDKNGLLASERQGYTQDGQSVINYVNYYYLNGMLIARKSPALSDYAVYANEITLAPNPATLNDKVKITANIHDIGLNKQSNTVEVGFYDVPPNNGTKTQIGSTTVNFTVSSSTGSTITPPELDQENKGHESGNYQMHNYGPYTYYPFFGAVQSFKAGKSGLLTKVSLSLKRENATDASYTLMIAKNINSITGAVADDDKIYQADFNSSVAKANNFSWVSFNIPDSANVVINEGRMYWIILKAYGGHQVPENLDWAYNDNGYAYGEAGRLQYGLGQTFLHSDFSKDLLFKTFVGPLPIPPPPTDTPLTATAEFNWDYSIGGVAQGTHKIIVVVDPNNHIVELSKMNNIATSFLFTDPTFIRVNDEDRDCLNEFLEGR